MLEPDPPSIVWSRPSSLRSVRNGRVLTDQFVIDEPDTLCVLPSTVRLLSALLTVLLVLSVVAAIINSLQGNARGSVSYCKEPEQLFTPDILCPHESMFFYYQCCDKSEHEINKCCSHIRFWLIFAIFCVVTSCTLGIGYTVFRYCCRCRRNTRERLGTRI